MEVSVAEAAYLREYLALCEKWLGGGMRLWDIKAELRGLNDKYAAHGFEKRTHVMDQFDARIASWDRRDPANLVEDEDGDVNGWLPSRVQEC